MGLHDLDINGMILPTQPADYTWHLWSYRSEDWFLHLVYNKNCTLYFTILIFLLNKERYNLPSF